jgi:hypothetical protein
MIDFATFVYAVRIVLPSFKKFIFGKELVYGKNSTNSLVCPGDGTCLSPYNCSFNAGKTDSECQFSICYGRNSSDVNVC